MAREEEIRVMAYRMWEHEGCPDGRDCEHWLKAETVWEETHRKPPAREESKTKLAQPTFQSRRDSKSTKK